ncbi:MAG TPA: hypothetical protein VK622_15010, partial [Puia sp.]|nr:hypothetical protein [Puia sp.]
LLMLDLFTGKIYDYPVEHSQKEMNAEFDIPPAGSLLFFTASDKISGYPSFKSPLRDGKTIDAPLQVIRKMDNSLSIDFCDLEIGDTVLRDAHVYDAADKAFKFHGFSDGNPWNTSVQFGDQTIKRDHFPASSGFTAKYFFNVEDSAHFSSFKAVIENPHLYKVELNGHTISPSPGKWWVDRSFKVFEIGRYIHKGKNILSLTAHPMSVYAEIEPVYILGNFGLSPAKKGWNIVGPSPLQLGSWKNQGMPMFGQEITYKKQIVIPHKNNNQIFVELGQWKGTVATVRVNNQPAGIISGLPYSLNITPFLQNGKNTVEVNVIGSLKNVFGPFHRKPEPGMVSPWHWRYVSHYPSGNEYDTYDYGLFEDFKIILR